MKLGIVGGVLQGMEAAYLARKAGYQTVVFDRWDEAPAFSLADESIVLDVVKERKKAMRWLADCDAVLPANENMETLRMLDDMFRETEVPMLFDLKAYEISSSKVLSNQYMERQGVPMPGSWPECGYPVVVKPSGQSGSAGVIKATCDADLQRGIQKVRELNDEVIVQEFVEGPNISIEVIGNGSEAAPMVLTEVVLDNSYDCRMVKCPVDGITDEVSRSFSSDAQKLAEGISLRGIMDVEAIVKDGLPKVLEIDARIPSQTPAAVYHATGINLVERLVEALVEDKVDPNCPRHGAAIYEHIAVDGNVLRFCGEGAFSEVRRPRIEPGLFGSDEMITDFEAGKKCWRATIICSGATPENAWARRTRCIHDLMEQNSLITVGEAEMHQ
ncbi:MAG: 3-methylornithine--L-lysine ligase PylC [Methanomassiliicoccus sp.]|nr:3-methylornithine--L-lysine ligase PylC [Methanomassiliicoccus sp.]